MMNLIDTHAHLSDRKYESDLEEVLARARAAGVGAIVDVADDLKSSLESVSRSGRYPWIFASVGIHPNRAEAVGAGDLSRVAELASEEKVVAVGETGLDFYRNPATRDLQERLLIESLRIASEANLPVILHCRGAYAELISILRRVRGEGVRGVVHAFSGNRDDAEEIIGMGYYISAGGPITYPKNGYLREIMGDISMDRIVLETDSPYLPPQEARGKRNEPALLKSAALELARLRGMPVEEVAGVTTANALNLFHKMAIEAVDEV